MSMPSFKDLVPKNLGRKEAINLLLASIAAEELGLAHIINAEAEKIQFTVGTLHGRRHHHHHDDDFLDKDDCCSKEWICPSFKDLLRINKSVERVLRTVVKKEIILQFKLSEVIELIGLSKEEEKHEEHFNEKRELEESIDEQNLL